MTETVPGSAPIIYLFTGFLEGGKTSFMRKMLEEPRMNNGKKLLVLLCEEGEEELELSDLAVSPVELRTLEREEDFRREKLLSLAAETGAERIFCEYNGMWSLKRFFDELPDNWQLFQSFFIADSGSILEYNRNMRQLCYEKLYYCNFCIFNRVDPDTDTLPYHKLVRSASSKNRIIFEYSDGRTELDSSVDPLPYDLDAPLIEIKDSDYAIWYRDLSENPDNYIGRSLRVKAFVPPQPAAPLFYMGRHVMVCCAADVQFQTIRCLPASPLSENFEGGWYRLKGELLADPESGGGALPFFRLDELIPAEEPEEPIASFDY